MLKSSASKAASKQLRIPRRGISHSAFAFLFSEIVLYSLSRSNMVSDLGQKLEDMGHDVGQRLLDLIVLRERPGRRDLKIVQMLQFVSGTCWKMLLASPPMLWSEVLVQKMSTIFTSPCPSRIGSCQCPKTWETWIAPPSSLGS